MSATYTSLWNSIYASGKTGDFIASISFDAINHIFFEHHGNAKDRDRYKYKIVRPFSALRPPRNFELLIDVTKPLSVAYEPDPKDFKAANGWLALPGPFPIDGSGLAREGETPKPNVRVKIPSITLQLKWPKVGGAGDHTWIPAGLSAELAAYISIVRDGGRVSLFIVPTMINFAYAHLIATMEKTIAAPTSPDECEAKFNDLLLIAMTEFSVELLPKLVQTIELPGIDVASLTLHPTFMHVAPRHVSIGATLDANKFLDKVVQKFSATLGALEYSIKQDITDAGGLNALVVDEANTRSRGELTLLSDQAIDNKLKRANQMLAEMRKSIAELNVQQPENITAVAGVDEGTGIAFNEYLATTIANGSLPPGQNKCSDELRIADLLKGQVCYWSRIADARIKFSGATINASVDVDFGGKIIACLRKFWDCSWRWACEDMGLSFVGRPEVNLRLLADGSGVRLACSVNLGSLKPVADLPWPFNKVVEAFFRIVMKFLEAILNLIALAMSFVVIPIKFNLPGQSTVVTFSRFAGFAYVAPGGSGSKANFIAHTATISAK